MVYTKKQIKQDLEKVELEYQLTKDLYNKKSTSIKAKIRHYNTVIKPECLYAAEFLALTKKEELKN